jgi:hypothetical protein
MLDIGEQIIQGRKQLNRLELKLVEKAEVSTTIIGNYERKTYTYIIYKSYFNTCRSV